MRFYQNRYFQALLIGVGFFLFFIALSSRDYMAVDGSTRCINVGYGKGFYFHGNNHMLYPAHIFFWHKILNFIGINAASKLEYMQLSAIMNALAASGVLAMFYTLLHLITKSFKYSFGLTICYAFSRAFLLHATNSTEPTVGLLWSILAIFVLVYALRKDFSKLIFLAGWLLALSLATYQSMVLISPATLVLCFYWPVKEIKNKKSTLFVRLGYLMVGSIIGVMSIYGWAFYTSGTKDLRSMVVRFFSVAGDSVYGSWSLRKFASLPIQFIRNVFPIMPGDFSGIVGWAVDNLNDKWQYWAYLVYGLVLFLIIKLAVYFWSTKNQLTWQEKIAIYSATAGIIFPLTAAAYWFPGYDKLWLQPNLCLILVVGLLLRPLLKEAPKLLIPSIALLLILQITSNLTWLIPSRFQENKALMAAEEVSTIVKSPPDLVIDGWDFVSLLYGALWSYHIYNFHSAAETKGKAVLDELPKLIEETKQRGGKVYFLGVLDETEATWAWFLGPRGLPYNSLAIYRQKAKLVKHYKFSAFQSSLYVLDFNEEK